MTSIDLIQPRHSYAPLEGEGHIYTNTSLRSVAARAAQAGVDVLVHDENIAPAKISSDIVGINLLGAPYIPVVKNMIQNIRQRHGEEIKIVLWGQVMTPRNGLTPEQFNHLFGDNVYNGMIPWLLENLLEVKKLPSEFKTSLIPVYEALSDELFLKYFSNEISFFVSQWCAQGCSFCAAQKWMPEKYRDMHIMYEDLSYIAKRLTKLGKNHVSMYITNLDVWQTPSTLSQFADVVLQVRNENPWFSFTMRWLAGTSYFMKLHNKYPEVIWKMKEAWFNAAWYGVDGIGAEVWKGIKKPQNTEENILWAIQLSREMYDITPELLMVFGHVGIDNQETLERDLEFVKGMVEKYNAVPRPHISKPFIPGNDGRQDPVYADKVKLLIEKPWLFQSLDFTALANAVTHGNQAFQDLVNHYYLEMCKLPGNTTIPIIPYQPTDSIQTIVNKMELNIGKFDR